MRVCDLLRHFSGNMIVTIIDADRKIIRKNNLAAIKEECDESFNPLLGFDCELWESGFDAWNVVDNVVTIRVNRKEKSYEIV